jgi:hypothetical protein
MLMFAVEDLCAKSLIILVAVIRSEKRRVTGYRNFLFFLFERSIININ